MENQEKEKPTIEYYDPVVPIEEAPKPQQVQQVPNKMIPQKEWAGKINRQAKEYGSDYRAVNFKLYVMVIVGFFLICALFFGTFIYAVKNNAFQSQVYQLNNITSENHYNSSVSVNNGYNNAYNFSIINYNNVTVIMPPLNTS